MDSSAETCVSATALARCSSEILWCMAASCGLRRMPVQGWSVTWEWRWRERSRVVERDCEASWGGE